MTDYDKIRRNAAKVGRDALVIKYGTEATLNWKYLQTATDAAISFYNASLEAVSEQLTPTPGADDGTLNTCDASVWASAFMRMIGEQGSLNRDDLTGWFANAIEYAAANHPDVVRLKQELANRLDNQNRSIREAVAKLSSAAADDIVDVDTLLDAWAMQRNTIVRLQKETYDLEADRRLDAAEPTNVNDLEVRLATIEEALSVRLAKVEDRLADIDFQAWSRAGKRLDLYEKRLTELEKLYGGATEAAPRYPFPRD